MAILKRCIAVTIIFMIWQSSTREISSLVSRRMTDRRCRKNHYGTSHQTRNVEKTEDSLRGRGNLRTFLDRDKTGDMRRRGDSYVEKKIFCSKKTSGTHIWDAPSRSSEDVPRPREWKEKQSVNWKPFIKTPFSFKFPRKYRWTRFSQFVSRGKYRERKKTGNM